MTTQKKKVFVMGIDGLDPKLVQKYIKEGVMPNTKKFLERGTANKELSMIGGHPTVTPPMWTTLATGASPYVHGVFDFFRAGDHLGECLYNFDSRNCNAEQLWNVTAEAGLKTLVWHWPGSSWPPTSDNENLWVVDGTQPEGVNCGNAMVEEEKLVIASEQTPKVLFRKKAATDTNVPCYITGMTFEEEEKDNELAMLLGDVIEGVTIRPEDRMGGLSETPFDIVYSPITTATGWASAPVDAKECTLLHSDGFIRRPCLILKNEQGIYDTLAIYATKKAEEPIGVLKKGCYTKNIIDQAIKNDMPILTNRNMRILDMAEDGSYMKMWVSGAMDFNDDTLWHPKNLLKEVNEHVGYPQPTCVSGGHDETLIADCMRATWDSCGDWTADAINYLAKEHDLDVIFSHFHNVDLQGHMLVAFLKNGSKLPPETVQRLFKEVYIQTDNYIGRYLQMLDDGWDIIIISDHGQTCPEHSAVPIMAGPMIDGINFVEWGYTVLKKDEDGNPLPEIDWSKTKAVNWRIGEVWINLKGRQEFGIVDPADKYELEEEIMTKLYELKSPETGHRAVLMALRNKDAVVLGMGGPNAGDIIFFNAEAYVNDHADSLSTMEGACDTSVMSVFLAAGPDFKENYLTDRIVHHVDVVPTIVSILGTRMPAQCEGAPVYQILSNSGI